MIGSWREWLYPLGLLPAMAFTLRFLLQWLQSEKEKKSIITPLFWKISLSGNALLFLHALIQMQFHVALIQGCNGIISWRNLNLRQLRPCSLQGVLVRLTLVIAATLLLFSLQSLFMPGDTTWFRSPTTYWHAKGTTAGQADFFWHAIGFVALALFNSRFWVQWWHAERYGVQPLGSLFWWMSLIGALLCTCYFVHIGDIVNLFGPVSGIIPYMRNLILITQAKKQAWQQKPI